MRNRDGKGRFVKGHKLNLSKKLLKEVRKKISESLKRACKEGRMISWYKGKIIPEDVREKISRTEKGKKVSEETRRKMSEAKKGIKFSGIHRQRLSEARKGIRFSLIHRKNLSKLHKGKTLSEEHKEKISKALLELWDTIGRKGYKRWRHLSAKREYRRWRVAVFEKNNYTCQRCGKTNCYLVAHHIKFWVDFPKFRYKVDNGITLCKECHKIFHKNHYEKINN